MQLRKYSFHKIVRSQFIKLFHLQTYNIYSGFDENKATLFKQEQMKRKII